MVTKESASYPAPEDEDDIFSIDANHSEIVKFGNSASSDYNNVRSRIIRLALDGQAVVSNRFDYKPESELIGAQGAAKQVRGASSKFGSMFIQFENTREGSTFRQLL